MRGPFSTSLQNGSRPMLVVLSEIPIRTFCGTQF